MVCVVSGDPNLLEAIVISRDWFRVVVESDAFFDAERLAPVGMNKGTREKRVAILTRLHLRPTGFAHARTPCIGGSFWLGRMAVVPVRDAGIKESAPEFLKRKPPRPTNSPREETGPSPADAAGSAGGITPACACQGVLDPAAFAMEPKRALAADLKRHQGQVGIGSGEVLPDARLPRRAGGDRPGSAAADGEKFIAAWPSP